MAPGQAAQLLVAREQHAAHAALAQLALDPVAARQLRSWTQLQRQRLGRGQRQRRRSVLRGALRRSSERGLRRDRTGLGRARGDRLRPLQLPRRRALRVQRPLGGRRGEDQPFWGEVVEPGDEERPGQAQRSERHQPAHEGRGQVDGVRDDVAQLQGAAGHHRVADERAEHAAPPELGPPRRGRHRGGHGSRGTPGGPPSVAARVRFGHAGARAEGRLAAGPFRAGPVLV